MGIFKPKRLDIDESGLAKVLGTLESEIVRFLWSSKTASARAVCDHLNETRKISFNAVNTVLGRLVEKGIVKKKKTQGCFQFTPALSREEMYRNVSHHVFSSLLKDKKMFTVAAFAEVLQELTSEEKKALKKALSDDASS